MRALVQRVRSASVSVDGRIVSSIGKGVLVLLGVTHSDTAAEVGWLARKIAQLRIFSDAEGKMNLSLQDIGGECLAVSQFTLYGECGRGNRPSFVGASRPEHAEPLYEAFLAQMAQHGVPTFGGVFGAMMDVALVNDGPVTLLIEREAG